MAYTIHSIASNDQLAEAPSLAKAMDLADEIGGCYVLDGTSLEYTTEPANSIESIRELIGQALVARKVPTKKTIANWLKEFGQDGIDARIAEHIAYWQEAGYGSTN